jgi:hypothetical protein
VGVKPFTTIRAKSNYQGSVMAITEACMSMPVQDHDREHPRSGLRWTRRHFAFYAVVLAVLLGFVASREPAMRWIADGVTAEYVGLDRQDSGVVIAGAAESRTAPVH